MNLSSCSHLWSAAPVDVHTDGTVCAAATHEQMSSVVRLHHADEVPTAVLENTDKQREKQEKVQAVRVYNKNITQIYFQRTADLQFVAFKAKV